MSALGSVDCGRLYAVVDALARQPAPIAMNDYGAYCLTCPDNNARYTGFPVPRSRGDDQDPSSHDEGCAWALARRLLGVPA